MKYDYKAEELKVQHALSAIGNRALSDLFTLLKAGGNIPSANQTEALTDLISCMDRICYGSNTPSKVFLSSICPGGGKTSALLSFLKAMVEDTHPKYLRDPRSALVCINSYREIEAFASQLPAQHIHVWTDVDLTSPEAVRKYNEKHKHKHTPLEGKLIGSVLCADRTKARILITTHAQVRFQMELEKCFTLAESLYFGKEVRTLRVWDESWNMSDPLTAEVHKLKQIQHYLGRPGQPTYDALDAFIAEAINAPNGTALVVPKLLDESGRRRAIKQAKQIGHSEPVALLEFLKYTEGQMVAVHKDAYSHNNSVLEYRDVMPVSMAPIVVLDASGRVRQHYTKLAERNIVRKLRAFVKEYSGLHVHIWDRGGGKSNFKPRFYNGNGDDLANNTIYKIANGIAELILSKPQERWLVVEHQENDFSGVQGVMQMASARLAGECARLGIARPKVEVITWGNHRASNSFASCENIILAGTLFLPTAVYEAELRAAEGRHVKDGPIDVTELERFMLGEWLSDILQSVTRIKVRQSINGACPEAHAYIIASSRKISFDAIKDVFPGCKGPFAWGDSGKPQALTDRQQQLVDEVMKRARALNRKGARIRFSHVYKDCFSGIKPQSFSEIRSHLTVKAALNDFGITDSEGKRSTGWELTAPEKLGGPIADDFGFIAEDHHTAQAAGRLLVEA